MSNEDIFARLAATKTMPELDAMRLETVAAMKEAEKVEPGGFQRVQNAFIKAKNRLQRIPLKDRTW